MNWTKKTHYINAITDIIFVVGVVLLGSIYVHYYTSDFIDDSIYSTVLKENRKIFIRLPKDYDAAKSYPLFIKSDGNFNLQRWDETLQSFSKTKNVQDAIVVAIPNLVWKGSRNRDLVPPYARMEVNPDPRPLEESEQPLMGQADLFLAFIESELLPYIESKYKIDGNRVLSGFSAGGSFALYTLVTKPHLFNGFFIFSPAAWYDDALVVKQTKLHLANTKGADLFLYMSLGTAEAVQFPIMKSAFDGLIEVFETAAPANLNWHYDFNEGAGHNENPYVSFPLAIDEYYQFRDKSK